MTFQDLLAKSIGSRGKKNKEGDDGNANGTEQRKRGAAYFGNEYNDGDATDDGTGSGGDEAHRRPLQKTAAAGTAAGPSATM